MNLNTYLLFALVVLAVSWLAEWAVMKISYKYKIFDKPNERKIHKEQIPRLGGIVFFPLVVLTVFLMKWVGIDVDELALILPALTLLYAVGITDDLCGVRYRNKFLAQGLSALLLCAVGYSYSNFYGLIGLHELPLWFSWIVTVFMVIFVTNAINFIDGIDGLASLLALCAMAFYSFVFYRLQDALFHILAIVMPLTLVPFIFYNVAGHAKRKNKIFMGDAGSLFLGLMFTIMSIRISNHPTADGGQCNLLLLSLAPILLPLLDVVHVVMHRLKIGANPFSADKSHIHHRCLAMGMSQHATLLVILVINAGIIALCCWTAMRLNPNLAVVVIVLVWILINLLITKLKNKSSRYEKEN